MQVTQKQERKTRRHSQLHGERFGQAGQAGHPGDGDLPGPGPPRRGDARALCVYRPVQPVGAGRPAERQPPHGGGRPAVCAEGGAGADGLRCPGVGPRRRRGAVRRPIPASPQAGGLKPSASA
eukprot:scaffold363223_cov33-Prasinocladus_malaysianus.AAC.1